MVGDLVLVLEEDYAELLDATGEVVWSSDEDGEKFEYDQESDAEDIIAYLVKAEFIDAEADVTEIEDARAEVDDDEDDDDDGDLDPDEIADDDDD